MYLGGTTSTISLPGMLDNVAQGGNGGAGGNGGVGGPLGLGGNGGQGGAGGLGQGGALFNDASDTATLFSGLVGNSAQGGNGGGGGSGGSGAGFFPSGAAGAGGSGNSGQGGGLFLAPDSVLNLNNTAVLDNTASGGLAGAGHPNGASGSAAGGGVYYVGATLNQSGSFIDVNGPNNTTP